ncbi:MAG: LacI family DNA-binding transcriptional regulator [Sphaerospermopsis kisseleviana]
MKKSRISQQQIAKDLGVSQTLVSMALNGRRGAVSKKSYEEIWNYATRRGYRPKGMAPELLPAAGKSTSVGFVLRTGVKLYNQSPFFGHVQQGLHEFLEERGISLLLLGTEDELDLGKLRQLYASGGALAGLVVMGEVERPFLRALKELEPRIVSVSAQYPGLCHSVLSNDEQAAEQLVSHLVDLGHSRFAWIGGGEHRQRPDNRWNALSGALRLRGLTIEPKFCQWTRGSDRLDGRTAAEQILSTSSSAKMPAAWVCFNGTMARGAANFLLSEGVRIPRDVSIAAFDRTHVLEEESPSITGAGADPEEIGRVAGEILLGQPEENIKRSFDAAIDSELVARESTGKVAVGRRAKSPSAP